MWLCGFREILQIIKSSKEARERERAKGLLWAQFHFRFCFTETVPLPLKSASRWFEEAQRSGRSHGAAFISVRSVYQQSHTRVWEWFEEWKSQPAGRQVTSDWFNVPAALRQGLPAGLRFSLQPLRFGITDTRIFKSPLLLEQNGKIFNLESSCSLLSCTLIMFCTSHGCFFSGPSAVEKYRIGANRRIAWTFWTQPH